MSHEIIVVLVCFGFFALMMMISDLMTRKFVLEISDIIFRSQIDLQKQIDMIWRFIRDEKNNKENSCNVSGADDDNTADNIG